jgi:Leucine-rich repeat (LRR) protein
MKTRDQSVKKLIDEARRERRKHLDLSSWRLWRQLEDIPSEVFELLELEELNLHGNKIRVIPERIRMMPKLKQLVLTRNPLVSVPDLPGLHLDWNTYLRCRESLSRRNIAGIVIEVGAKLSDPSQLLRALASLPELRFLRLGLNTLSASTEIKKAPETLWQLINGLEQCEHLEKLVFFGLRLDEVPASIRGLKKLRTLSLFGAGLEELPHWISELQTLETLSLGFNELRTLPGSLANLPRLGVLSLSDNRFTGIPEVIFRIKSLKRLILSTGRLKALEGEIKQVPASILELTNLEYLDVENQPIEEPPLEVISQGLTAIQNYWRQQQEAGIDYLCEAKLIIVGEAGAGKTSLAKKLRNQNYKLEPQERSTEGIEVIHWNFPTAMRIRKEGREEVIPRNFKVNIWDFGGQEIYHATHQFFLTRRSLYVLVSDDRKEDTDFQYWLQVVELLSERSPLLVVQNEKQDRQRDIDLGGLRARFPSLQEAYRTNLATNRGLDKLVKAIQHELERLPHIGTSLPKTWSRVRDALEKDPRDYISLEEYLDICQRHGFTREEDKLQLSGYLHDLGTCLHFQDDPVLKSRVILKPKWGTDAVYRVLDDHVILDQRGRFGPKELERIWAEDKYAAMRHELLRLMMKFQLCYQLPDREEYIAPQLLSATRPAYDWDDSKNLVVRYQYEFMPKGLITRFIVGLHHRIADQSLVWRGGVILEREETRAEVIEDYPGRKIVVRVRGADTQGLLAIVDDQLERIHRSFPHLKYEKHLPCNCARCRASSEPYLYPLSELRDFARDGDQIQCRASRKLVDAGDLLREVLPSIAYFIDVAADHALDEVAAEPDLRKEVYVSYAWEAPDSMALVDQLEAVCNERDIALIRDKNKVRYKDSIRDFMSRMGQGKCIVVVLSKQYLESKFCMFELTEIAERGDLGKRVFPIVLAGTNIDDASGRLDYIEYWEKKTDELNSKMKRVKGSNLQGIREELDLYEKIRATLGGLLNILGDMNVLSPERHRATDFEELLRALDAVE